MSDPARAVFSIFGKGTAVAISEDLLVTCENVVKDAKEVTLFSHHPVFEGETKPRGKSSPLMKNLTWLSSAVVAVVYRFLNSKMGKSLMIRCRCEFGLGQDGTHGGKTRKKA